MHCLRTQLNFVALSGVFGVLLSVSARGAEGQADELKVADKAPDFSATGLAQFNAGGKSASIAETVNRIGRKLSSVRKGI